MKKDYSYKTLSMLTASLSVLESFELEKARIVAENNKLEDPFAANYQADIEIALRELYGINSKEQLKKATKLVNHLKVQAKDDLGLVKTQIERGFRNNKERTADLMEKLGYNASWRKACKNNQSEVIALLLKFDNNMDEETRSEMENQGVNSARLDSISLSAKQLQKANVTQETLKGTSKIETEKATAALNQIYQQAMDICLLGQRIFKNDKTRKDLFIFSKLIKNQGVADHKPAEDDKPLAA
jgi:hypothetical protein